ncbi:MAG: type I secretion C-terminal target domain-containing protein [Proteobacteria bacterium]|nr:type I secretion C-terminal target domain-containing protein [Pseudomonadota bacterium]
MVKDFSAGQGDIIDIADMLDGYYTYGVDDIADFIQITDNGTDATLKIDQNGGADNFVTVATLPGVTGITGETALETAGILVTV